MIVNFGIVSEPIREPGKNHWCIAGSHAFQCTDKNCKWPFEVKNCPEHPGKGSIIAEWANQQQTKRAVQR